MKIEIGQIGLGYLGKRHCAVLANMPEVQLVGVYDIKPEKSRRIASQYHVKPFFDLEKLIDQVQALIVAVPTRKHFEIVETALLKDRHVFVEKPISTTIHEADRLIYLAEKRNLVLQVGHIERFNPAVISLEAEKLDPQFIVSNRLAPFNSRGTDVAVVLDLMIHDLDLVLNFVKSKICKIEASGFAVVSPEFDIANARIQFEGGCVANLTASRISPKKLREMLIYQKDSFYTVDFIQRTTKKYTLMHDPDNTVKGVNAEMDSDPKNVKNKRMLYEKLKVEKQDPLELELKSFLKSLQCKQNPVVDGKAGRFVLEVASEIMQIIGKQSSAQ